MTGYGPCLDPKCPYPAEVIDRSWIDSTSGPVEHAATLCIAGHRFYGPTREE